MPPTAFLSILDCCGAFEPSMCPHCGSRGRAASLDHPPAEVRDYLQVLSFQDLCRFNGISYGFSPQSFWGSLGKTVAPRRDAVQRRVHGACVRFFISWVILKPKRFFDATTLAGPSKHHLPLQNPLTQFRASSDVAMFQLDHFRSVAKQASAFHHYQAIHTYLAKRCNGFLKRRTTKRTSSCGGCSTSYIMRGGALVAGVH